MQDCPIVGFIGANGYGKTLVAVTECIRYMRLGVPVYSTVPITSEWGDSLPLTGRSQLLGLRNCVVLLDEVEVIFSSRTTASLPPDVTIFLHTLRHRGVILLWTAPAWKRADVLIREVTQVVVGLDAVAKYTVDGKFWPTPRFVFVTSMDCTSVGADDQPERTLRRRFYRLKGLSGWGAYDSEADTPRLGWPDEGGRCVDCGGRITPARCTPERHVELGLPVIGARAGSPAGGGARTDDLLPALDGLLEAPAVV
ncbi:zonular occludens toxin (Zot) [mine drainage metagenome]|uniref:Zonular occludens toxin (Zot) n=1 Tax=mine drainage metagenome TaxID=410659 RepID=A0A1J5RMH5_9ZZZZ